MDKSKLNSELAAVWEELNKWVQNQPYDPTKNETFNGTYKYNIQPDYTNNLSTSNRFLEELPKGGSLQANLTTT